MRSIDPKMLVILTVTVLFFIMNDFTPPRTWVILFALAVMIHGVIKWIAGVVEVSEKQELAASVHARHARSLEGDLRTSIRRITLSGLVYVTYAMYGLMVRILVYFVSVPFTMMHPYGCVFLIVAYVVAGYSMYHDMRTGDYIAGRLGTSYQSAAQIVVARAFGVRDFGAYKGESAAEAMQAADDHDI